MFFSSEKFPDTVQDMAVNIWLCNTVLRLDSAMFTFAAMAARLLPNHLCLDVCHYQDALP